MYQSKTVYTKQTIIKHYILSCCFAIFISKLKVDHFLKSQQIIAKMTKVDHFMVKKADTSLSLDWCYKSSWRR